jgi:hypothetical protein
MAGQERGAGWETARDRCQGMDRSREGGRDSEPGRLEGMRANNTLHTTRGSDWLWRTREGLWVEVGGVKVSGRGGG